MLKTIRLMLLTVLTMVCGSMFADDNVVTWQASSGDALTTISVGNDITLKWEEGGGDFSPRYSGNYVYFYNGNRLTVAGVSDDVIISKVVFKFMEDTKLGMVTCDKTGKNESSAGITSDNEELTTTWVGETKSVIFRASKQTGPRYIQSVEVTYSGSAGQVEKAPELNITNANIADTYDMDANSVFVVYYENKGNLSAENAKLALYVDGEVNCEKAIGQLAPDANGFWNAKYDLTNIEPGEHQVYISFTADNADPYNTVAKTVTFTKKAPQATFELTAQDVEVEFGAAQITAVVNVKNTSDIDAENVQLNLWRSGVIATETISALAAGANENVTFTFDNPFNTAGTYELQVLTSDNMYGCKFNVTMKEEVVEDVKDLAITEINGSIDLANETSNVRITVSNNGNVDITDAPVTLTAGESVLGTATVTAKAGQTGFCYVTVSTAGLEAGELNVTATVEVEDDANPADNTKEATLTVKAVPLPEPTFAMTAADVVVESPSAENITVVVNVKNTSEVNAENVAINLIKGMDVLGTETIEALAAGEAKDVTFTVANPYTKAGDYELQVMTADKKFNCYVNVKVMEAVEEVVDIALVDIRGLENIDLKNETNAVQVWFTNNSTVEELNATITLTMNGAEVGTEAIATGENYKSFTLPTANLVAGEEATLVATLNVENNKEGNLAEVTKTLPIISGEAAEPTLEVNVDNVEVELADKTVKVVVNVKNTSEVKADQVEVKILNGMDQLGESKYIFGLEGGAELNLTFTFNNFDKPGTYELQALAGNAGAHFQVTVKAPVTDLATERIAGTIDLNNATNIVTVTVMNNGTADVNDAKATLSFGETVLEETISVQAGETGFANFQVASEGIEGTELAVTAKVEVENDVTPEDNELTSTLTVKAVDAPQATFSVAAENVTVPFGAESFDIVAKVTNTSEVAGNVDVKLLKGITEVETKTVENLAAGEEATVTFTRDGEDILEAGKTATYYVQAGLSQAEVEVTFAEEPVTEVKDMAIEAITGTIDLSVEQSNVSVTVKNNGNVDVKDAKLTLSYGETVLEKTVSAKAGENGYAFFQVPSEGIEGTELNVTATVELEGDATPEDNTMSQALTVKPAPVAEPTFSVAAENVEVAFGAESFDIVAKVKNTSEVNAENVEVKLLKGITEVETKTIAAIAAGEEATVTFTRDGEDILEAGSTATYYVQAANKAQAEVKVNFAAAPVEEVIDMALTQIQGVSEINLKQENKVMVWYQNLGNVATNATISATLNDTQLEAQTVENVKAEGQGYVEFTLPVEGLNAGETATFVATIAAEGDANAENNVLNKVLNIVSGETEPQPEIALNNIPDQEVGLGEQEVSVVVSVFNNGDADAKDVKIDIYKNYPEILATQTVDINAGESAILTFKFNYNFEKEGVYEFTAYTMFADANTSNNSQNFNITAKAPKADVSIAKIADIQATTEEDVKIVATVKNSSEIEAKDVTVAVFHGMEEVGIRQTIETIPANGEATAEFNIGKLEAGTYNFTVQIVSEDANTDNNTQAVTVKVTEPVVPVVDMAIVTIQGLSAIDLQEENKIQVWYQNMGNVAVESATVSVKLNDTELEAQTVSNIKADENGWVEFTLPVDGLVAGEKATVVATITVENDVNTENNTLTKEYNVVNGTVAEPTFAVTAQDVEVELDAETFEVELTVKNTSEVEATNVEVKLYNGMDVIGIKTIETLAANAEATVNFTVNNPYTKAGNYELVAITANKVSTYVQVTVKDAPVVAEIDMEVTAIMGLTEIDLQKENQIQVWYKNNSNVPVESATITVKMNDTELEAQTVSNIKVEGNGYVTFTLPTEGLVAGEKATVVATITTENDINPENDTFTKEYDIIGSAVVEPTFALTAEDAEFFIGEPVNFTVNVKNTSEVDAQNVEVKILYGTAQIASQTIETLGAGEAKDVVFTGEIPVQLPAGTYELQAVAGKNNTFFNITLKEVVEPVIDMALTAIQGITEINLKEENKIMVWYKNNSNVDVESATISVKLNDTELEAQTVSDIKADANGYVEFTLPVEGLTAGEKATVVATITVENDVNTEDNTMTKEYEVTNGIAEVAELAITAEDVTVELNAESFAVKVTVKNLSETVDAENVEVKALIGVDVLGSKTIEKIAAGMQETVTITVSNPYTQEGKYNDLHIMTSNAETWVNVTVSTVTAIEAIKAVYGKNVQIFTLNGKKVNNVKKGGLYIINGKKVMIK